LFASGYIFRRIRRRDLKVRAQQTRVRSWPKAFACFTIYASREDLVSFAYLFGVSFEDYAGGLPLNPMVSKLNASAVMGKKGCAAVFEYNLLEAATNHFHERSILGEGGRGVVYKARLSEKLLAAVKMWDDADQDAQREFEVFFS